MILALAVNTVPDRQAIRGRLLGTWANAANGRQGDDAAPARRAMNSRRLMCSPQFEDHTLPHQDRECGVVHHGKIDGRMAEMGIKTGGYAAQ
jgi:hypothetical protein